MIEDLTDDMAVLKERAARPVVLPPPPPPFVCVLVDGERQDGGRMTLGRCGTLQADGPTIFELHPMIALADVRMTVFADVSRVNVLSVYKGRDLLTADLGDCPIAFADRVHPGEVLRVQCSCRP